MRWLNALAGNVVIFGYQELKIRKCALLVNAGNGKNMLRNHKTNIGINWFVGVNIFRVNQDLLKNPALDSQIPKSLLSGFVMWAARRRIVFQEDIFVEVKEYLENKYAKNLSWINNKSKNNLFDIISKRDGKYCCYCDKETDLTLDHIFPRSLGGGDEIDNLQILCRSCNSRKGQKLEHGKNTLSKA